MGDLEEMMLKLFWIAVLFTVGTALGLSLHALSQMVYSALTMIP
jgi:uncharacterized protein HemY